MSWDPSLMKKLLKSEVYESMNSARVHCSQENLSTTVAETQKKKKKAENVDVDVYPNPHYINALSLDHSYFMSTLRPWNHYWKSCMKESVAVIWEEGPYHIGLSLEDTDGRICRKRPKIMLRSMTSVKGSPRASINLEAHWILFLVHGHLHNGVST